MHVPHLSEFEGFTGFPNDKFLFDILDTYCYWNEDLEHFKRTFPLSPVPLKYIDKKLLEIQTKYLEIEKSDLNEELDSLLRRRGYWARVQGEDIRPLDIQDEYLYFLANIKKSKYAQYPGLTEENWQDKAELIEELELPATYAAHTERIFFILLSDGANDAIFEGYLANLKKRVERGDPLSDEEENLPEIEKGRQIGQIAWLHELGIIETIMLQSKDAAGNVVPFRAAKVINSITGLGIDAVRKAVIALKNNDVEDPYHPFNQIQNVEAAKAKRRFYKIG